MLSYLNSVWRSRYFWMSLVKMDLRTRYRRSLLGMGWSLLHPIAMTAILCFVFSQIFMPTGGIRQYAPFLLAGLATWNYILTVSVQGCQSLYIGEPYIRQYPAPLAIYPLRTALGGTLHFLIALCVVLAMSWILKGFGNLPALLFLFPSLILLFLLVWSMAVLTAVANVYFQDSEHLCEVGFQVLFYTTPILYGKEMLQARNLGWVADYNPLAAFLELIRCPILTGEPPSLVTFLVATLTVLVVGGAAVMTLKRNERKLIFHL
jgi:ABC-type polysaccharide/polyol phosphate export permease